MCTQFGLLLLEKTSRLHDQLTHSHTLMSVIIGQYAVNLIYTHSDTHGVQSGTGGVLIHVMLLVF